MLPFVSEIKEIGFKEIAQDSDVRFNMWICKKFKVLPTSPDFQNLTFEMREILWEDYLLDNPKIARQVEVNNSIVRDSEFNELWEDENTAEVELEENVEVPILPDEDDIEYSSYGRNILNRIKKNEQKQLQKEEEELSPDEQRIRNIYGSNWEEEQSSEDWEEVDLEYSDSLEEFGDDFDSI